MRLSLIPLALLHLFAAVAVAAPPKLTIPTEAKPVGGYVRFTPETDAVSVTYVSLDGLDPFPSEELKDGRRFLLPTNGVAEGKYRFVAVAASKDGEQARADFVVVVGTGPPPAKPGPIIAPPPTTPTDPKPPVTPAPTGGLYFLIVRPDGPATAEFTKAMGLPAWKTLATAGHLFKDKTLAEAAALGVKIPDGTTLPTVVTLVESADGKSSRVVRGPVPLPTTEAGVLELAKAVK